MTDEMREYLEIRRGFGESAGVALMNLGSSLYAISVSGLIDDGAFLSASEELDRVRVELGMAVMA